MAENLTEPEATRQLAIMQQMLVLAQQQVELSADRSRMSADRSRLSEDRSRMSAERSEMSEQRCYHNAERTLSVWVRTSLSLMVLGMAVDQFGLLLHGVPASRNYAQLHGNWVLNTLSSWSGAALVLMGVFMALITGWRFMAYAQGWRKAHQLPAFHNPWLATFFALMAALFGLVLLSLMWLFAV